VGSKNAITCNIIKNIYVKENQNISAFEHTDATKIECEIYPMKKQTAFISLYF